MKYDESKDLVDPLSSRELIGPSSESDVGSFGVVEEPLPILIDWRHLEDGCRRAGYQYSKVSYLAQLLAGSIGRFKIPRSSVTIFFYSRDGKNDQALTFLANYKLEFCDSISELHDKVFQSVQTLPKDRDAIIVASKLSVESLLNHSKKWHFWSWPLKSDNNVPRPLQSLRYLASAFCCRNDDGVKMPYVLMAEIPLSKLHEAGVHHYSLALRVDQVLGQHRECCRILWNRLGTTIYLFLRFSSESLLNRFKENYATDYNEATQSVALLDFAEIRQPLHLFKKEIFQKWRNQQCHICQSNIELDEDLTFCINCWTVSHTACWGEPSKNKCPYCGLFGTLRH